MSSIWRRVAQIVIELALGSQAGAVQRKGADRLDHSRVEVPPVGRDEPGPAKYLAGCQSMYRDRLAARRRDIERHLSVADQIELVGLATLAEDHLPVVKPNIHRAAYQNRQVPLAEGGEERVIGQNAFQVLHRSSPLQHRDCRSTVYHSWDIMGEPDRPADPSVISYGTRNRRESSPGRYVWYAVGQGAIQRYGARNPGVYGGVRRARSVHRDRK